MALSIWAAGRRFVGGVVGVMLLGAALTRAVGAEEREPFRVPDWVSMPATNTGIQQARKVLARAQGVYAGIKNYEHSGVTMRHSRVIGSRSKDDWAEEDFVAVAFDRATGRYAHVSKGCRVWFDGERVIVQMDDLKSYRTALSNASAAPENAVSLVSSFAAMPKSLRFIRDAALPLDEVIESLSITEIIGVIPERREGKDGHWVVMAGHLELQNAGIRVPYRWWFDDETGMLRAMEADHSAWYEAQRPHGGSVDRAKSSEITETTFSRVVVDAPTEPVMLTFRPTSEMKEVTTFWKPEPNDRPDPPPVSNENPLMVDRINKPLGDFVVERFNGGQLTGEALKGKPALIAFGFGGESDADLPHQLQRVIDAHKDAIRVVLVLADSGTQTRKAISETLPASFTGDVAIVPWDWVKDTYGREMLGSAMLVDGEGVVRDIVQRHGRGERSITLETAARQLVAGELHSSEEELATRRARAVAWRDYWQRVSPMDQALDVREVEPVAAIPAAKSPDFAVRGDVVPTGWRTSNDRRWIDVDSDGKPELVMPGGGGRVHVFRLDGQKVKPINLEVRATAPSIRGLCPVRTEQGVGWLVLYYDIGGSEPRDRVSENVLDFFESGGRHLWRYQPPVAATPPKPDEHDAAEFTATAADLNGDGIDEILVGANVTRYRKVEGELNSWTAIRSGGASTLVVLDIKGRTLSLSEFGFDKIDWIEPMPGTAAVLVSANDGVRRVEFKGLRGP